MSTSDARTASPSPVTPAGALPDEAALRRAFDAHFAGALAGARLQLGDATPLAPRVVETAFLNVWAQRETLGNDDQLKSVLSDEVRHGAARALSRRHSGARFGAVGGSTAKAHEVSADNEKPDVVWAQIEKALHGSGHTAELHRAAAEAGRHEAVAHMKAVSKRPGWVIPLAIGVVALALSVGGMLYVDRLGEDDAQLGTVASSSIQPISSPPGQLGTTTLGDGTKMRIGPDTKIFIPDGFATKNRVIKVEGTAAFEVAPGQQMPFRIVAHRYHFIATGTKFVISTFTPDSTPSLLVQEGSVTVKAGKNTAVVAAGQAVHADDKGIRAVTDDERQESFAWIDGRVTVRNKQLRQVVEALTRWFNYDVKVPDLPLLDRQASLDVPLDSSRLAITQVEKSANVKFAYEGETKIFRDAGPGGAKKK
ncbi:MAG TPA: FecR domain-containing protein [Gemmatimonadaceae bacterium]|jgi:ferric-dicitrate binding protein FerR (iron transport regulator)|nr:FecR domain-containing protein [Gemmatimonadaceae bacterium]